MLYITQTITEFTIAICLAIGMYLILNDKNIGLGFVGIGLNLLMIVVAKPGHPLAQSLALTAVVIRTGTLALWILNTNSSA